MQAGIKTGKRRTCTRFLPSNGMKYSQVIKLLEHKYITGVEGFSPLLSVRKNCIFGRQEISI